MPDMRAKVLLSRIESFPGLDILHFNAVGKTERYGVDGADDDNTYARFTPSAEFKIHVVNSALVGKFKPGEKYYVNFTPAEPIVG